MDELYWLDECNNDIDLLDLLQIQEGAADQSDSITNQMQHMIKYACNPNKQTSSWANSILDDCFINNKIINDKQNKKKLKYGKPIISDSEMDEYYEKSLIDARKEKNKIPDSFSSRPNDWTYSNLSNIEFVVDFLKTNYGNKNYSFDIDAVIERKLNNRSKKKK